MLDAISDFWKPSRKNGNNSQIDVDSIKVGSTLGFGFIPQSELSGRRVAVKAINTYMFDAERMTSFVLDIASDSAISLIISISEQAKFIAISRRIPFEERAKLFDNSELLGCMGGDEKARLRVKANSGWAGWLAPEYKRDMGGLKGKVVPGDYRGFMSLPDNVETKEFSYTLLVSSNNEYALEIEQYSDNKMDVYATVYRSVSDIGEVDSSAAPAEGAAKKKPPMVAKTASQLAALRPANDTPKSDNSVAEPKQAPALESDDVTSKENAQSPSPPLVEGVAGSAYRINDVRERSLQKMEMLKMDLSADLSAEPAKDGPRLFEVSSEEKVLASLPHEIEPVKKEVPNLSPLTEPYKEDEPQVSAPQFPQPTSQAAQEQPLVVPATAEPIAVAEVTPVTDTNEQPLTQPTNYTPEQTQEQKEQTMATFNANINGNTETKTEHAFTARAIQPQQLEVENDSVECELPAANRVIEEAIRNEMSMSDVVRRIIALPVARQESVSIPVLLTDSDYSLLAVRYGIPAADRAAIKAKIMEEIGEFSGK